MPKLSIIIVNWNTKDFLRGCIQSILSGTVGVSYEIIVVDNASSDDSAQMVTEEFEKFAQVKLIVNEVNTGFAKGNNQGYIHSSGEYIITLNPDTIVQPGCLKTMVDYAENNPYVGIVGCKFLNPNGALQRHYRRFPDVKSIVFRYTLLGYYIDKYIFSLKHNKWLCVDDLDFAAVTRIDQLSATCLLISRKVIESLGGLFDERFSIYCNDWDLCRRAWDHGFEIHVLPSAKVIHYGSEGLKQLDRQSLHQVQQAGIYEYFKKHHSRIEAYIIRLIFWMRPFADKGLELLVSASRHIESLANAARV